jgi:teichuronic acid biosynthesis glycosyltransferase TuaH
MPQSPPRVGVISLEPWDDVWRRNQHFITQLLDLSLVRSVVFVEPATRKPAARSHPRPGLTIVRPTLRVPRRLRGLWFVSRHLRRGPLRDVEVLWINDAVQGQHLLGLTSKTFYDVTDDWRASDLPSRIRRRLVRAEDVLTSRATVIVCSEVLQRRWAERYGSAPAVVLNGADVDGLDTAKPMELAGHSPHLGYVGTLHSERLDVELVQALARDEQVGTLHLIGPDHLDRESRDLLQAEPSVRLEGPVGPSEVNSWLVSLDLLVCPHRVTDFTLSLDGIKRHEYAASGKPFVATPTSGFQLGAPGGIVADRAAFVSVATDLLSGRATVASVGGRVGWADRARDFALAWP